MPHSTAVVTRMRVDDVTPDSDFYCVSFVFAGQIFAKQAKLFQRFKFD